MKYIGFVIFFIFGILVGKYLYDKKDNATHEQVQTITSGINNLSKLVVSEANFAQIYSFKDSKKYFFDFIHFNKKAVISTDAKVEIGYDLSKLDIEIDSVNKKIIINSIPPPIENINPNVKYITLEDSGFNEFTVQEHNKLKEKALAEIKKTSDLTNLRKDAKKRLIEELSKIFQLTKVFHWTIVNNTSDVDVNSQLIIYNKDANDRLKDLNQEIKP